MVEFAFKPMQLGGFKHYYINANGTYQISTTIGTLHAVIINIAGGAGNTCTIYDAATAAQAVAANIIGVINSAAGVVALPYNICFRNGLQIVLAGGTTADITVAWY